MYLNIKRHTRFEPWFFKLSQISIAVCLLFCLQANADQRSNEYKVKALFLYNFANFVDWPKDAFGDSSSPIKMCLFGDVEFGSFLDAVNGTLIGDRELRVVKATELAEIKNGCHILFVDQKQKVRLPKLWNDIKYLYVLSIGEKEGFADKGGIINIIRTHDNLQFEINISNALANGLFIGSDLLSLAREIKRNTSANTPKNGTGSR